MLGSKSGLVTLIQQKNPLAQSNYCMLHREALMSKTLPRSLCDDLSIVIKGSTFNIRLFQQLYQDLEAGHDALLFHMQARWLSKGNMLQRVLELFNDVVLFLEEQGKTILEELRNDDFHIRLVYLANVSGELKELNKKFQRNDMNILIQTDKIKAFVAKLDLWKSRVERGNFVFFG